METVLYEVESGIATITLNRPEVLNALNGQISEELAKALQQASSDPAARCVVVTGGGRAFCAGADLNELEPFYAKGEAPPVSDSLRLRYHPVIQGILDNNKPVVASINGVAAGAGCSLALACDFRIASDKAGLYQAFIKIGLLPDSGANFFLPRLVGLAKAIELGMLGDKIDAEEALRLGLVTKVVPHDSLAEETKKFAAQLAAGPTKAYSLTRKAMYFGASHTIETTMDLEADSQQELAATADHMEGVLAFLGKRAPNFEGR
jgi:2-(1,2-epoxy-1,2-dihydrophenyl)acetyl-CoA isomerase